MDVSIIILTKNAGEGFNHLLHSIFNQKIDEEYEVIVIDSGSMDGTVAIAKQYPIRMIEIEPERFHHGKTRNFGGDLSSGRILVFITQDALPIHNDWLQKLIEALKDPEVAMVVGRQIPWPDTKPPEKFFYGYYFPEKKIEIFPGAQDYYRDNLFISNVNSAIKRSVWQSLRFSENILRGEDKEFAKRLLLTGWKIIYQPEAVVYHAHNFSLISAFRTSIDIGTALGQNAGMPRSKNWIAGRLAYFFEEAFYLASLEKWWKWIPYSLLYEMSKLSGVILGWLTNKLSQNRMRPKHFHE